MGSIKMGVSKRGEPPEPADAIARLRLERNPDLRLRDARALLQSLHAYCAGAVDITLMSDAADAVLTAIVPDDQDAGRREAMLGVAHDTIDLARLKTVRQAAYPADAGSPGGRWLDHIIQLIDQTDFTLARMFRQRAAQYKGKPLFVVPHWDRVTEYTWEQVAESTEQIARGILDLVGDNPRVALFSPNRIEGALVDLACLTNGIFNTIVPANAVESQLRHIVVESGVHVLFVSGSHQVRTALTVLDDLPSLEWVITLDPLPGVPDARVMPLQQLIDLATNVSSRTLEGRVARLHSDDVATTMYTSGTTGTPKGIKFSHLNLVSKRFGRVSALPDVDENEVFLCYLPLYHTFGRYLEMLGAVHLAATYVLAEDSSTETLVRHMQQFKPTAWIGVPKKWLDLRASITATDEIPDDIEQLRRTTQRLTGGRLRWGLSAAGHLSPSVFHFFQYLGIDLLSGYGMTEATGGITMTPPGQYVDESIGKALPAIELAFGDDDELMLRGPYVTGGYTDPQDDAVAFKDGWFCTGDIVARNAAGFLRHVDRKKEIYKNASGRTIAPQRVEALFADAPEISRVFAVGDGREFVTLLIRPNFGCSEVALAAMSNEARHEYFRGLVVSCNHFLAPFERVVNFALIDRDFSAEQGEITSKGSVRRSAVQEHFSDRIERMYAASAVKRFVGGLNVSIPIAFLQHLGVTETDAQASDDGLVFPALAKRLRIQRDEADAGFVWIGNCRYHAPASLINLDDWLRLPELWIGNAELTDITGEDILFWSLSGREASARHAVVAATPPEVPIDTWRRRFEACFEAAPTLLTIHAAAVILSAGPSKAASRAVDYLAHVMAAGRVRYEELAACRLRDFAQNADRTVRSRAFAALWERQTPASLGQTASLFCESLKSFLDQRACERIASLGMRPEHWRALRDALRALRQSVTSARSARANRFVVDLLRSLGRIADLCEDYDQPVRREVSAWMLAPATKAVRNTAAHVSEELRLARRRQIGDKQAEAVDAVTGRRYGWKDLLRFEEGLDPDDLTTITNAVHQTELVRLAIHALHQGQRVDLPDMEPGGIWISPVSMCFGRSVYHAAIRLRNRERCDFTLYVRRTEPLHRFLTDLHVISLASGDPDEPPLTPHVVGYWPEHGVAVLEHIAGDSLEFLVRYMHEHAEANVRRRLKHNWTHLCWSALAAAVEFHRRTEYRWALQGTTTRDITVPLNDFKENTRIFATAGWRPINSKLAMIVRLKHAFLDRIQFHFPGLASKTPDEIPFAAIMEACGPDEGLSFLKSAIAEATAEKTSNDEIAALRGQMEAYVRKVGAEGYRPKALHFAVKRFHAWTKRVPDASVHARAAQLRQLRDNYHIDAVSCRFPETHLRLYFETVLKQPTTRGRKALENAIARLREGADDREILARLANHLQKESSSYEQRYFLTRAAYPHLDPDEKAQMVTRADVESACADLVTLHTDRTGREFQVKPVANPVDMDTLYRAFYAGGIGGGLRDHEKFLVVADQLGYIVGGLAYVVRTPSHVLLDKITVLPRCRGRGIGRLLLLEFLRRQAAQGVAIVSAEFVQADWLAQFGFEPDPRYAGVVLSLADRI